MKRALFCIRDGRWALECSLIIVVWLAGGFLSERHPGFAVMAGFCGGALLAWGGGEAWRQFVPDCQRWALAVEAGVLILLRLVLPDAYAGHLSWGALGYRLGLSLLLRLVLWAWLRKAQRDNFLAGEGWRVALVLAAALWVTLPLVTDRFVGGTDAVWYAYSADDYRDQRHHGVFPVFIGQGQNAYNGAIHTFRSAPAYTFLAGVWDELTFRTLSFIALQHLTALSAAMLAGLGMYLGLGRLGPSRWAAALCAAIYVTAPAVLNDLYAGDMYMTYIAAAALPLVICGNAEAIQSDGRRGFWAIAAGLALTWMGHPLTGIYATLATLALQAGRLAFQADPAENWRTAVLAAAGFGGFSLHYFWAMSERTGAAEASSPLAILQCAGLMLGVMAAVRFWTQKRIVWLALAAGCALGLIPVSRAWAYWLAVSLVPVVLFSALRSAWPEGRRRDTAFAVLGASFLLGAAAAWWLLGRKVAGENEGLVSCLRMNGAHLPDLLHPVSAGAIGVGDCQPGWALLACGLGGVAAACFGRGERLRSVGLLALTTLWLGLLFLPLPWVSEFWLGYFPEKLGALMGLPLGLRLLPTWSALAAVAGGLAAGLVMRRGPRWHRGVLVLLAAATLWSVTEAYKFVRRGFEITSTRAITEQLQRPENRVVHRYVYDLLHIPDYYCDAGNDWRLESRVLDQAGKVIIGPEEVVARMERQGKQVIVWEAIPMETNLAWLELQRSFVVPAGQTLLLHFEFPWPVDHGYLIFKSPQFYRDYTLPESGFPLAFGTSPVTGKVLTLVNTTASDNPLTVYYQRDPPPAAPDPKALVPFARVVVSRLDPELLPIQVSSLIPYRARVNMTEAGFLETPRVMLPGYEAMVDGKPAPVMQSRQKLVMIPLAFGPHEVELRYVGTFGLRLTYWISTLCWLTAGIVLLGRAHPQPRNWLRAPA